MKSLFIPILMTGLCCIQARAESQIEGTLISFNAQKATLRQDSGAEIHVPRSAFPDMKGYIVGQAKVRVMVSGSELLQLNPDFAKTIKRKPATKK